MRRDPTKATGNIIERVQETGRGISGWARTGEMKPEEAEWVRGVKTPDSKFTFKRRHLSEFMTC